jgi:hypothetical protein
MLAFLLMLVVLLGLGSTSAISPEQRDKWNVLFGVPVEQDVDKYNPTPKVQPTFRSTVTVHETPTITHTAYITRTPSSDAEPTFAEDEDEVATSTYSVEPTVSEKDPWKTHTQEPVTWPTHATIMSTIDSLPESYVSSSPVPFPHHDIRNGLPRNTLTTP